MSAIRLNNNNFDQVRNNEGISLLDFYADWCGPCRMLAPILSELADEHPEIKVAKINVDDEGELALKFEVMNIPSLFVIKDGKVTNRALGVKTKAQLLALFE